MLRSAAPPSGAGRPICTGPRGWRRPSWVFRIFDHACPKHSRSALQCHHAASAQPVRAAWWETQLDGCRGLPIACELGRWRGGGGGCSQSGTHEWDRAWVAQGRGPCRDRGESRRGLAVMVLRAQDSLAARMLAAALKRAVYGGGAGAWAWAWAWAGAPGVDRQVQAGGRLDRAIGIGRCRPAAVGLELPWYEAGCCSSGVRRGVCDGPGCGRGLRSAVRQTTREIQSPEPWRSCLRGGREGGRGGMRAVVTAAAMFGFFSLRPAAVPRTR